MASVSSAATLGEIGQETIQLLDKVKTVQRHAESTKSEWPQTLFAAEADRFELWAVNLGLFMSGHGSLDYRVREAERMERTLRRFMSDLNGSLTEVLEYCAGEGQWANQDVCNTTKSHFDESQKIFEDNFGDDTSQDSELDIDLLLDSVRDTINRLYKLSIKIRNPSSRLGSSKAQSHQQIDRETGIDLLSVFGAFDYDYVSSLFLQYRKSKALGEHKSSIHSNSTIEQSEDNADHVWEPIRTVLSQHQTELSNATESFLIRRIAHANVRRRQQFAYWKKHRDKLSQHASIFMRPIDSSKETTQDRVHIKRQDGNLPVPRTFPVQSVTTASRLNISQLNISDDRSTVAVSVYTPSEWQPGKEVVDFPDPPKQPPGEKFFECPFCFTLCSAEVLAPNAWRAHLIHDLRPYICTYEDCRNPDQQYDSRQEWILHENFSHRRIWRCPEHPDQTFLKQKKYLNHMRSEHFQVDDKISDNITSRAGESTLTSPDRTCPTCSLSIESVAALQSHIALHLERFSLFSLPRSVDEADNGDEEDSNRPDVAFEGSRDDDFNMDSKSGDGLDERVSNSGTNEAEPISRETLARRVGLFGPEHPSTLESMEELAVLLERQGKYDEAEPI
ncbi:hypothetical protein BP5796_12955 [Coleophoma crateriformis]|uniref:C2H2-type domain-containing protein n=1 Tax=Coleophoma crateriformis TaxID=565419 RepID=A0A3D8Q5G2_9HELO|nr:hypothetical protein BP5796_12955 [Coleophoma crateriformis]